MSDKEPQSLPQSEPPPTREPVAVADRRRRPPHEADLLGHMLKIADVHRDERRLRQATEIYFTVVRQYEGTAEARRARKCLMDIACEYEQAGELHLARSFYERLL